MGSEEGEGGGWRSRCSGGAAVPIFVLDAHRKTSAISVSRLDHC